MHRNIIRLKTENMISVTVTFIRLKDYKSALKGA